MSPDDSLRPTIPGPVVPLPETVAADLQPGTHTFDPGATRDDNSAPAAVPGYELLGELGRGAVGVVYRARNARLNRVVALKMLLGRPGAAGLLRFCAEAETMAAVRHPHVAQVYEAGEVDGRPFLALELVPGGTLTDHLSALRARGPRAVAELVARIASGVAAAHDQNIVHRDLKPGNVLLDATGAPKVTDFGLAKRLTGADLTATGAVLGTPAYMAPEQAAGQTKFVGPAADVWALGVILYEALVGRRPFEHPDTFGLLRGVLADQPVAPRRLVGTVPRDLETICLKCLEKDPVRRYPTANELADDLGRFVAGRPVRARPPGPLERAAKWARRNPARTTLAATALVAALFGALFIDAYRARQHDERAAALVERLRTADAGSLSSLLTELELTGGAAAPHLRALSGESTRTGRRAKLALLAREPAHLDALYDWLLEAEASEFQLLVDRLRPRAAELVPRLWAVLRDPETDHDRRFRAACATAQYDADNPDWGASAASVVERLLASRVGDAVAWTGQLRPVIPALRPALDAAFGAESGGNGATVAAVLAVLAADDADWLLALVRAGSPEQSGQLAHALAPHAAALRAPLEGDMALVPPAPAKLEHPVADWAHSRGAPVHAARARAALALLHLGDHEPAWRLLRFAPDPQTRTYLIHWFQPARFPLPRLIARFRAEPDPTARRALLQALGGYAPAALTPAERDRLGSELAAALVADPDPGVHSSAEWLLRRWGQYEGAARGVRAARNPTPDRNWYATETGHTLAVVRGPVRARLGSSGAGIEYNEAISDGGEGPRRYSLDRDFAIGTHEVTVAQFRAFSPKFIATMPGYGYSPEPDCPVAHIFWHAAADYCNWLTLQEGMGAADQCYRTHDESVRTARPRAHPDALLRRGYRLPTEAEWEYACRAGTTTSRYWGDDRGAVMRNYAVCLNSLEDRTYPVWQRKPNDLGLFDPLGNVWEWVHDPFGTGWRGWPDDDRNPDWGGPMRWESEIGVLRGCSFTTAQMETRAARRRKLTTAPPSYGDMGFRIARTLRTPTAWELKFYLADYGPNDNNPPPPPGAWEKAAAGEPIRVARADELYFQFTPGGTDPHVALVATGTFTGAPGDYDITVAVDAGARLFVDGKLTVDAWNALGLRDVTARAALKPGAALRVEYWHRTEFARLAVTYKPVRP